MTDTASTVDIAVELELPPDFHPMTLGVTAEEARAQLLSQLGEQTIADVPETAIDALAREYAAASQWLERNGVFYAGTCLGLLDGELTLATLTLARTRLDCRDPELAVEGIVEVLGSADPEGRQARRYELPCGPAAVVVGAAVEMVLPAAEAGTDEDFPVPTASLEAWVPVPAAADPSRQSAVVLRFSTPSLRHWEAYCPVLVEALQTLRFPAAESAGPLDGRAQDTAPGAGPAPTKGGSRIARALG
jgi:hypothetical protein